jgi:HK97 family phage prohead protease
MRSEYKGATALDAQITESGQGTFTAVASTGSVDRDGEVIVPGAFSPLPASIPVHLDHDMRAANVVARARPYYEGNRLLIDASFGSDPLAQEARRKVTEGLVDSVSIVFLSSEKRDVKGVPTVFRGELLACDLVSVPANAEARILSSRSLRYAMTRPGDEARATALLALAEVELAEAKAVLRGDVRGPVSRSVDAQIRTILRCM